MPTTQPLDEDDLSDIAEGPFKPIAEFLNPPAPAPAAPAPKAPPVAQAPAARPAAAPAPRQEIRHEILESVAPAARGAGRIPRPGITSFSIKGRLAADPKAEQSVQTHAGGAEPRAKAYSPDNVKQLWLGFIEKFPAEHLLVNAMRAANVEFKGDDTFNVTQSPIHIKYISENIDRVTAFVRNALGNDNIRFTLTEVNEDNPMIWNERQVLEHIVESNPAMAEFIRALGLKPM